VKLVPKGVSPLRISMLEINGITSKVTSGEGSIVLTPRSAVDFKRNNELRKKYELLLNEGNHQPQNLDKNLYELRKLILLEGLPLETEEEQRLTSKSMCTLRGKIWKILLRVPSVDANKYIQYVQKGPCKQYQKIRNDTFRTFKTNLGFQKRVPEERLIRVLNAFIHSCNTAIDPTIRLIQYVQGMNVVCAPFLYVMPELDGFWCFSQFVKMHTPLYFHPGIEGAFEGLKLLDEILKLVDNELYSYLISKDLKADVYAMPPVLSFSGSVPPLEELLKLWDFLLAFGPHLNIVCFAAQIVLIRDELLSVERPNILQILPPLNANLIISIAVQLVRQLPEEMYKHLLLHPFVSRKPRKYSTLNKNFKFSGAKR